jgi:hypothetical protein
VIYRGDPSGTSYIWTEFVSKVSGEWKNRVGRGIDVKWPVGKPSAKGSGSLARLVKETPNSIGYLELTFALQNNLPFGSIRNLAGKFIKADLKTLLAAAASKTASIRGDDFRISLTNASGESFYPIASFTCLLVPKNSIVPSGGAALKDFLQWLLTEGQGFAVDLGYARLPNQLIREELAAVEKLSSRGKIPNGAFPSSIRSLHRLQNSRAPWISTVGTCSILTTTPNAVASAGHDQMNSHSGSRRLRPVARSWLGDVSAVSDLLKPHDAQVMRSYPVSSKINSVANDDAECSAPVELAEIQNRLFSQWDCEATRIQSHVGVIPTVQIRT